MLLALCLIGCDGAFGAAPTDSGPLELAEDGAGGGRSAGTTGGADGRTARDDAGGTLTWAPVETDWCSDGWSGFDDHTCFHVPPTPAPDATVVYVLHGMMAADTLPIRLQETALEASDTLGFIALFPRGRQGLCTRDPSFQSTWCWPTSRETVDIAAPALLDEWMRAETLLQQVLGVTFRRRFVMGFSNGGYFASYIGLEGLITLDGAGLVGAGRSIIEEELFSEARPPIYLAVGEAEMTGVIASAENLADVLTQQGWEHTLVVHTDRGHEIHADDFAAAWETWAAR